MAMKKNRQLVFLGCLLASTGFAQVAEVPALEKGKWWIWANPPAINIQAEQAISRPPGAPALEVRFAYTIDTNGRVTECGVPYRSEAGHDDQTLCALIALHQYRPAPGNRERVPIRTSQTLLIGVSAERARNLMRAGKER